MNRKTTLAIIALLLLLAMPKRASAQLRFIPQAGLYAPVSDLGEVDTGSEIWELGKRESSLAYGLGIELGGEGVASLRLGAVYGSESEVPIDGVGCTGAACTLRSTVLTGTAALIVRPIPGLAVVKPYLVLGGGLKRYDFDFQNEGFGDLFGDESEATGRLGLGLGFDLGAAGIRLEVSDYFNGAVFSNGDTQHDFIVTLGLSIGG